MRKRLSLLFSLLLMAVAVPGASARGAAPAAPNLFGVLPQGDVVVTVDMATLFEKTIPVLLAKKPESKAKLDANVAKVRTDFGLDLRQVRQIAVSASLLPDGSRMEWVAAMDGAFDALAKQGALAATLDAFAKRETRFSVRADAYEGMTIYVLPEKLGDGSTVERNAAVVLDARTALYGTPAAVRRAVDAKKGKVPSAAASASLVDAYVQSDATSPVRLGMQLDTIVKSLRQNDPNDPFLTTLSGVRYLFGSLGLGSDNGLALRIVSRANTAEGAKTLLSTLQSLLEIGRESFGNKPETAALLALITVTSSGSDVLVSANVPPDRLDTLFQLVDKNRTMVAEH